MIRRRDGLLLGSLAAACCVAHCAAAHGLYTLLRFRKNSLFAANVIIVDMSVASERASFRQRRSCIAGKRRLFSVRQHEVDVAKVVFRTRDDGRAPAASAFVGACGAEAMDWPPKP